jgi:hypothetical protein
LSTLAEMEAIQPGQVDAQTMARVNEWKSARGYAEAFTQ